MVILRIISLGGGRSLKKRAIRKNSARKYLMSENVVRKLILAEPQTSEEQVTPDSDGIVKVLRESLVYGAPLPADAITDAMERTGLSAKQLKEISELASEGAISQFARGFEKGALQYLSIAVYARRSLRARKFLS